jgi:cathepsin B
MTDRICIASKGAQNFHISAEDLVCMCFFSSFLLKMFILIFYSACCDSCGFGCDGGFPQSAWSYYKTTGLVTGGNFDSKQGCEPYTIQACDHQ